MNCPIILLGYNKFNLTRHCLHSVLQAGYPQEAIHLVDNGSRQGGLEPMRQAFPGVHFWRLEENAGYAGGFNYGLEQVFSMGASEAFFLSNDTELQPRAIETCSELARKVGAGIVAPAVFRRGARGALDSIGGWFDRQALQLHHFQEGRLPQLLGENDYVPGSALWIARGAFERLGGMDRLFFSYWEDADLSFRARELGIPIARCYEAEVWHRGGATCGKKHLYTAYYYRRNRIRFCRRHLTAVEWEQAWSLFNAELEELAAQWERDRDANRLAYLKPLREELARGRETGKPYTLG